MGKIKALRGKGDEEAEQENVTHTYLNNITVAKGAV